MKPPWLHAVICAVLFSAGSAHAIDDRFDPAKYDKGGFATADDAAYRDECGSCHFTYLPGMLPARSWHKLIADSANHFGESLSLAPARAAYLERYLVEHSADHSDYQGSRLMLNKLAQDKVPIRITALPLMRQRHVVIRKLQLESQVGVKKLTNCDACHRTAATGSFAFEQIIVPGVTRVPVAGGNVAWGHGGS